MGLKQDIVELMGSIFGQDIETMFEKYYDESNSEELLLACKDLLSKLLGSEAANRHFDKIIKKYPELKKLEVIQK